jgi:hypothetical protein
LNKPLIALILAAALSGCATQPDPARAARAQDIQRTIPVCDGERDCAVKWEAAQLWVAKNAAYKLQTVTTVLIQTYNPSRSDTGLAASVTKEPLGGGKYRILARLWCDNMFGCHPDSSDALLRFNLSVGAATP